MWNQRPFRRPGLGRGAFRQFTVNPQLIEAHRLFEIGNYAQAAQIFENIANVTLEKGNPQAPRLYLQAGFAWMKNNDLIKGIEISKKGLNLLIERQKWGRLRKASDMSISRMKDNGFINQANDLQDWLDKTIPPDVKKMPVWIESGINRIMKNKLPNHCPSCGGPINLNDVEWRGSVANCIYCGSLLTGE
jgi:hypothetical protein